MGLTCWFLLRFSLILDNERWKQADVPAEFQALVDHISTSNSLTTPSKQPGDSGKLTISHLPAHPFAD